MSVSRTSLAVLAAALTVAAAVILITPPAQAQGCVASRMTSPSGPTDADGNDYYLLDGHWQMSFGYRGYRSHRHFVGSVEQSADNVANGSAERDRAGSEVINHMNLPDFNLSYGLSDRISLNLDVPVMIAARRSPYSSSAKPSYETHAHGIGDLNLVARAWIADPQKHSKQNLAIGVGVKAPTGNDRYEDGFLDSVDLTTGAAKYVTKPVDQSIQPGDGGWGFITDFSGFKSFGKVTAFASGSYLFNPREQNDFLRDPTSTTQDPLTSHLSIADQFAARAGVTTAVKRFGLSLAARMEGVPSHDLIGGDLGRRRPGYSIAVEPGLSYSWKRSNLSLSVPYLVRRVRTQSNSDEIATQTTGVHTQGDAAFADVVVVVGYSRRF